MLPKIACTVQICFPRDHLNHVTVGRGAEKCFNDGRDQKRCRRNLSESSQHYPVAKQVTWRGLRSFRDSFVGD